MGIFRSSTARGCLLTRPCIDCPHPCCFGNRARRVSILVPYGYGGSHISNQHHLTSASFADAWSESGTACNDDKVAKPALPLALLTRLALEKFHHDLRSA